MPTGGYSTASADPSRLMHGGRERVSDRVIGIVLGIVLGIAIVAAFVFLGSGTTIDAPSLSGDETQTQQQTTPQQTTPEQGP